MGFSGLHAKLLTPAPAESHQDGVGAEDDSASSIDGYLQ